MEEDRLKDIFINYEPELSSRMEFMQRLERNLNAVEIIHRENAKTVKRNRIAVIIASLAGFLTGFIFSIIMPYIVRAASTLVDAIPEDSFLNFVIYITDYHQVLTWMIIGGISVLTSVNCYNRVLNFQLLRDVKQEG